ncbi:MAG TPA: 4-alpha-glucanotransferase [Lapillicoccus sp.]|nr:4-alpha-glucanotransferase [Lapillicoccus sp.]
MTATGMPAGPSEPLTRLAAAHGVATDYWDWQGRHAPISAATIEAVLAALGVPAHTPEEVEAGLREVGDRFWRRTLPATVVTREGSAPWVYAHVPDGTGVRLTIDLEDGREWEVRQMHHLVPPRWVDERVVGEAAFELPWNLPLGWHRVVAHTDAQPLDPATTTATVVVTPHRLGLPEGLDSRRAVGVATQLYQLRSAGSWGIGDLADLSELGRWASEQHDADFVLVNPLHAAEPVPPMEPSPYLPTTRRFLNPLYLRVEAVPEVAGLDPEDRRRIDALAAHGHVLNDVDGIDRDGSWELKRAALGLLHAVPMSGSRADAYQRFVVEEGEGLVAYATWCALAERYGLPVTAWPTELQDPHGDAIPRWRAEHASDVDLHCWMQWLLAEQVGEAQAALRGAGMRVGVIEDLAVGVHTQGSDAWSLSDVLAAGVSVGAPPDQFNQLGQRWDQPPWRPDRLAEQGYRPFRDMVRTALRDSGGVRIDHVIGLFRLWWIPQGLTPDQGTYVRYDHEALVGILALEAQRAGAIVIGEDLGVVEPSAREYLLERGVLGTSILWFEWENHAPKPPDDYRALCLSSVTTHDLPPTAGYLGLEHVAIRERLGLLTRSVEEEREAELGAIGLVRSALVRRGLLEPEATAEDFVVALHSWLAQTPSRMLVVGLADLVGDRRAVNQPGTLDDYPNWRVPLTDGTGRPVRLEDVTSSGPDALAAPIFRALGTG